MRARKLLRFGGLLAALVLVIAASTVPSDASPGRWRDFFETGRYVLYLGENLDEDAKIYQSESASAYLVVSSKLDYAVLILPRTRCVESVLAEEMETREDGGIDIKKEAVPCSLGRFTTSGQDILFTVKSGRASLRQKPHLLGGYLRDGVLRHSPQYLRAAKPYEPREASVEALRGAGENREVRIQVFFGTWCSFCNRFVPYILKLEDLLGDTGLSFEYFGLPAPPAFYVDDMTTQMGIKRLPTAIVFVDDRERARIVGTDWAKIDEALLRQLR